MEGSPLLADFSGAASAHGGLWPWGECHLTDDIVAKSDGAIKRLLLANCEIYIGGFIIY
jgi:hypothetical protein